MYLKKGSTIAIAATARHVDKQMIEDATNIFESWGLNVLVNESLFAKENAFAGSDEIRAKAFQELLDNEEVNAIIIARGGYGTVRIIDQLDFTKFIQKPKLIAGFSDVTVLHAHINQNFGVTTLHSCMPVTMQGKYFNTETIESLKNALFGNSIAIQFAQHPFNKNKNVSGELVGGNFSVLFSLLGSKSDLYFDNKILFIEDIGEYFYHIDRMIQTFKRAGKLKNLKALIVGGMNDMNENSAPFAFNKSCFEIIREAVQEYNFPVFYGFPAGHENLNLSVWLGKNCSISVDEELVYFEQ
jgi:muramoyltetrapeptide carboxypeptidase